MNESVVLIVVAVAFFCCDALEFVRPLVARMPIPTWVWRVWALNAIHVAVAVAIFGGWTWMADAAGSILHLSTDLPCAAAGAVAYVAYTFVFYCLHRARHASDPLWRVLHQVHHSPRRLEAVTAFYKHPLETLVNAGLAGVLMFRVLGLDLHGSAVCTMLAALADFFYHANIRTPAWTVLLIQRPEMHRLHHEADRHEGNYGDLPLWDWMFGTLRLPHGTAPVCGFTPVREERLVEMLVGVDVHRECGS